jgi:hypothetical protein
MDKDEPILMKNVAPNVFDFIMRLAVIFFVVYFEAFLYLMDQYI